MKILSLFLLAVLPSLLFSQNENNTFTKHFDGFLAGANAGAQNIYGAAFVDEKFVLARASRFVSELTVGYRKQFLKGRLVAGASFDFGLVGGDLTHVDLSAPLHIDYKSKPQWSYGLALGATFGPQKKFLLYGYLNETSRKFDVTITDAQYTFDQNDEEGVMRFGLGFETPVYMDLHVRAYAGGLRADFDKSMTNIDVEDKMDFMLGLAWQF